jgi:hypothetical protein
MHDKIPTSWRKNKGSDPAILWFNQFVAAASKSYRRGQDFKPRDATTGSRILKEGDARGESRF